MSTVVTYPIFGSGSRSKLIDTVSSSYLPPRNKYHGTGIMRT